MSDAGQLGLAKREAIQLSHFVMSHAPVVVRQKRSRFASHNGRLSIRSGEGLDGLQ
jgi:hypothetical protein